MWEIRNRVKKISLVSDLINRVNIVPFTESGSEDGGGDLRVGGNDSILGSG